MDHEREDYDLLGVRFDCKLGMAGAVRKLVGEASWKLRTLVRSSNYHCDAELVLLYKSRLLGYLEYRTSAVYHATDTALKPLNNLQDKLLREVGCTDVEALFLWNLAPLETRRDIAMLGLVHRAVLGKGPTHFERFFKKKAATTVAYRTRAAAGRHDRQLEEVTHLHCPGLLRRSAFGLIRVCNLLPREVVATDSVKEFQRKVQDLVKAHAEGGDENWKRTVSPREPWWSHPLRKRL